MIPNTKTISVCVYFFLMYLPYFEECHIIHNGDGGGPKILSTSAGTNVFDELVTPVSRVFGAEDSEGVGAGRLGFMGFAAASVEGP